VTILSYLIFVYVAAQKSSVSAKIVYNQTVTLGNRCLSISKKWQYLCLFM